MIRTASRATFVWFMAVIASLVAPAAVRSETAWEGKTVRQWAEQLNDPDVRVRWYATYALGQLGPKAADATEPLHKMLQTKGEQEYVRGNAAWAIGRMGDVAESEIPLLMETMHSVGHVSVRRNSVEALGNMGPAARRAVPELVKMLDNDDAVTRINTAVALWKIAQHPRAVPFLLDALRRGVRPSSYQAAVALGSLGAPADVVAPALVDALHEEDPDVRRAAARSLGQIGRAAFPALKQKKALDDPDADVRVMVVEAIEWMGPTAVKPLIKAMEDTSPEVRRAAARALGRLDADARPAESALVAAVNDPREEVRDEAAKALRRIRGE